MSDESGLQAMWENVPVEQPTVTDLTIVRFDLIRHFAENMTARNWADKAAYIAQAAERGIADINAAIHQPANDVATK